MQLKVFDISSIGSETEIEELNRFMRGHKILDVDKQFYTTSDNVGHWSVILTYLPVQSSGNISHQEKREKVDYKTVLNEADFEKFTKLRALRKMLASDDAVPAYAVFTDAELAQIAQLSSIEEKMVMKINGIGEKRIEKYGRLLCELYNRSQE